MSDPRGLLERLCKALDERQKAVKEAEDWYEGNHPLPDPPPNTPALTDGEARKAFTTMSSLAITNMLPPISDTLTAGLRIEGFQFSESGTSTDDEAWRIYQRNYLDADSRLWWNAAGQTGQSFGLVWPGPDGAEITVEDPSQCIVMYVAGSRRKRAAGLKRWVDEDGYTLATLYTPEWVYKFRSKTPNTTLWTPSTGTSDSWEIRQPADEAWPLANPLGEVPLVEIRCNAPLRASQFGGGRPLFAKQINDQRKINHTVMSILIAEDNQSFRQRWATGWDYPTNPDGTPDKQAMAKFSASRMAVFNGVEGEGEVKVGEFSQADFRPMLEVMGAWVKVIASTSGTPPYAFLIGDMINVAADALARIEGVKAANQRAFADEVGESPEEIMRLALKAEGNPKANDTGLSIQWAEFEQRTATEQIAVAQAMKELGAPEEVYFAALPNVSKSEARRWAIQKSASALLSGTLTVDDLPPQEEDPAKLKAKADAFGALVRAGVGFEDAAMRVGLPGLENTGAVPVTLRFPEAAAEDLE